MTSTSDPYRHSVGPKVDPESFLVGEIELVGGLPPEPEDELDDEERDG